MTEAREATADKSTARSARVFVLESVLSKAFWRDRWLAPMVVACLVINCFAFGYVIYQYPRLPEFLPLHYNFLGDADYIGVRAESFKIPVIGAAIWLANMVLGLFLSRFELGAARLLMAAALVAQVLILVAVITIIY